MNRILRFGPQVALIAGCVGALAQTVWEGSYAPEQATRGEALYQKECGFCHGEHMEGEGFAPPLVGAPFAFRWQDGTLRDLLLVVKATMPQDRPGGLQDSEYAAIVAYMLKSNEYPSGQRELSADPEDAKNIPMKKPGGSP